MVVETRPVVKVEEMPPISVEVETIETINNVNNITGTIADKDRYLLNTGGSRINPATEDTLSSINSKVATESTLSSIDSKLNSINSKITACNTNSTIVARRVSPFMAYNQLTVGTSATPLVTSSIPLMFGVVVKADINNSGNVYVGDSSVSTSNGYCLTAGEGIAFEIYDASKVYVVADTDNQKVYWLGV